MTNTNHTPGPWTIDHERIGPPGEPVALLCDTNAPKSGTVVEWPRYGEVVDDAENEANARLIASAPDTLAALEALMELEGGEPGSYNTYRYYQGVRRRRAAIMGVAIDDQERADEVWQAAHKAIAKAKGGE